jgi:hypothetical protein
VLFFYTRNMNAEERFQFFTELQTPPPGVVVDDLDMGIWSRDAELASFGLDLASPPPLPEYLRVQMEGQAGVAG